MSGLIRGLETTIVESAATKDFSKAATQAVAESFQPSVSRPWKFRNPDLEEKTKAMQAEFEQLLGQRNTVETRKTFMQKDEIFYSTMSEFYQGHKKHESPTRRLMAQMDAACENKSVINSKLQSGNKYQLTYCPSPDRAYVVEPHEGELNYDQAHKNLDKFYKKVMNQDITKHSLQKSNKKVSKDAAADLK